MKSPDSQPDSPSKLLTFLPLLYVAWADGVLTESEHSAIVRVCDSQAWLTREDKDQLATWLDPNNPPSASLYHLWLRAIRRAAENLPEDEIAGLASLGNEILVMAGGPIEGLPIEAKEALDDIERELGFPVSEILRETTEKRPESDIRPVQTSAFSTELATILAGEYATLRDTITGVLCETDFTPPTEPSRESYRERVLDWCKRLADLGLGNLAYPKSVGGKEDIGAFMVAFETLAYGDLSLVIKFGVQFGLFGGSIHQLGTSKHHKKYLSDIGSLRLPGCFAMTERGHGSNVRDIETTAVYHPDTQSFVINTPNDSARKEYIGNAACHGRLATVFAQLTTFGEDHGVHAFVVPLRDESGNILQGIRIEDNGPKLGLNGVDNGRIWFQNVHIPRENLLDRFAQVDADGMYHSPIPSSSKRFFTMLGTLVGGRISVASAAVSASKTALAIAVRYNLVRRQFGPKDRPELVLLDYPSQQRRLMPALASVFAFHFALNDLQATFSKSGTFDADAEIEGRAAGLKALATWLASDTIQTCRECCGGQGYMAENRFAALKADTDIFTTFEGDNTVLLLQVAKGLLTEFRRSFSDLHLLGLLKYLVEEAGSVLLEKNPYTIRQSSSEHLRDPEFLKDIFQIRSESRLQSAAREMKRRMDRGTDSFQAFLSVQNELLAAARAHVENLTVRSFFEHLENGTLRKLGSRMRPVAVLYALSRLEADKAWFLENGYMDDSKTKALSREVTRCCAEVREIAPELVDSFGIPDPLLRAPIAFFRDEGVGS